MNFCFLRKFRRALIFEGNDNECLGLLNERNQIANQLGTRVSNVNRASSLVWGALQVSVLGPHRVKQRVKRNRASQAASFLNSDSQFAAY